MSRTSLVSDKIVGSQGSNKRNLDFHSADAHFQKDSLDNLVPERNCKMASRD